MMSSRLSGFVRFLLILGLLVSVGLMVGCSGDDGAQGPAGPQGPTGPQGPEGPPGQDLTATLEPESCSTCHSTAGDEHQAIYTDYMDESQLTMDIQSIKSVAAAGAFDVTMTVKITKAGLPYVDADGLPALDQARFYVQGYDSATRSFPQAMNSSMNDSITAVAGQPGVYEIKEAGVSYAPEKSNAFGYGYIAQGLLDTEPAGHVSLYEDVANAGLAFGDVDEYSTYANVSACETCHGSPYMKHGYRAAAVPGLPDFAACKVCHYDDRTGGHEDWQQIVDDPVAWGNGEDAGAVPQYAYKAKVMNDVHMSHAMEFPYPQKMANCATCHEGQMDNVFADEFFTMETCKSCHGVKARPEQYDELTFYAKKAPSLETIWEEEGVGFHNINLNCGDCHGGEDLAAFHNNGYDPLIYTASGERYADGVVVTIDDDATYDSDAQTLTIAFSATSSIAGVDAADIVPAVFVSGYGYDTKNALVPAYPGTGWSTVAPDYFDITQDGASWTATYDTSGLEESAANVAEGSVRRIEIGVASELLVGDVHVAVKSQSRTFNLEQGAYQDYYSDVVNYDEKCVACHDQLMPHESHNLYAASNVRTCRQCHAPPSGSGHLEMQSRDIASYLHSIHSFQAFDVGDIDFTDNVEAKIYGLHIEHTFPRFTIKNCEGCHEPGVFNPPDQTESLPAVLSASDDNETWDRKIGNVPSYVVGPASRACGGCHRAEFIKEDDASGLASFNQHTKQGGYLVEDGDYAEIVAEIMELFDQ